MMAFLHQLRTVFTKTRFRWLTVISRTNWLRALRVVAHIAAWLTVASAPLVFSLLPADQPLPDLALLRVLAPSFILAGFFYLNYWVLIPRVLAQRRFGRYFALIAGIFMIGILPALLKALGLVHPPDFSRIPGAPKNPVYMVLGMVTLVWLLSSSLRVTGEWFKTDKLRKQLERDRLEAELALLKSQVNPHFLFNTLNNVYSLAELKSDAAPAAILRLSHLMRYMLYEADAPRVPLTREVEYLRNYVALQELRLEPGRAPIRFEQEGDIQGLLIEPMLLIPLVENAFKHGISYQHASPIDIELAITGQQLRLRVHNRCFAPPQLEAAAVLPGGVGLTNVRKRLDMLYPGQHALQLDRTPDSFTATLTLTLHDD